MDQVTTEDTAKSRPPAATSHIHPMMPPEERLALWRSVRARWKHDSDAMVRDIEKERDEWDQPIS